MDFLPISDNSYGAYGDGDFGGFGHPAPPFPFRRPTRKIPTRSEHA